VFSFSFYSIHIGQRGLILYLHLILRICDNTWLVMLSHAVMSVLQVFPSFVMLSLACIFVSDGCPSIEMWFDHGEDRCCGLSKVGMVEAVGSHQVMWLVILESAMDWILGVDTPGQHVPPRVLYGTACLLIRYAKGCVSCSAEWGWLLSVWHSVWTVWTTWCKGGHCVQETSTLQAGQLCAGNRSKAWHTPVVDLCIDT
jgi:hypothetical protein